MVLRMAVGLVGSYAGGNPLGVRSDWVSFFFFLSYAKYN